MEHAVEPNHIFCFGLFEADPARGILSRSGVRVKIQEQPFRLLLLLLERAGEIVSREELRQKLWPEGTFVDFDGSLNVILKRLRAAIDDDPENPRFIETVPRRGYRFIAPVSVIEKASESEKDPRPVPASAISSIPVKTIHPEMPAATVALHGRRQPRRRYLIYGGAALAVLVVGIGGWLARHSGWWGGPNFSNNGAIQVRPSVAVLGFRNLAGRAEDAWLATALSEMLSTELAGGEKLRLVSGEDVANLRVAAPWSQTDTLDQSTTARIGNSLGSDLLVLGSYTTIGNPERSQIRIDIRLQDARSGEILAEVAEIGSSQDLF